ncbi:MAG: hypothetical protein OXB84_08235 [Halobacteriovoraceae bacterium]|nr:hypothetical protein [Halobacteriovoraceae bacterium]
MKKILPILFVFLFPATSPEIYGSEIYTNEIASVELEFPYTEVCFKSGFVHVDIHNNGGHTRGGHCHAGDIGFIIEKNRRGHNSSWYLALETCLRLGMRLPEPYEWTSACNNHEDWLIQGMKEFNKWEWVSNKSSPMIMHGSRFIGALAFGDESCDHAVYYPVGHEEGYDREIAFRCAL